jgi:16S rRNA processing protein RimM
MAVPAVVIGRIGRPHGVRGAVRVRPTGPTLATLTPGEEVEVRTREGGRRLRLDGRGGTDDNPILSFAGVADREEAAALAGAAIAVEPERVPPLEDPDTFYVRDLIGCEVMLGDRPAGVVEEVLPAPANDVLAVAGPEGELLLPFTADAVRELDLGARRIVVRADLLER